MRIRDKSAAGRKKYRMMVIAVLLATVALSMSAFAGQWRQDDTGWWYQNEDGTYVKSEWSWIDGRCYYFNEDGYCLQNTQTPDGYSVDGQGPGLRAEWYRCSRRFRRRCSRGAGADAGTGGSAPTGADRCAGAESGQRRNKTDWQCTSHSSRRFCISFL